MSGQIYLINVIDTLIQALRLGKKTWRGTLTEGCEDIYVKFRKKVC